jgi:anti-sigma-K factor RskA
MPDSVPPQEDASLYVLDLLEGAEREAFEVNLAQSADLQRQVRELQVNLEALALAAPPRIPRPQVWDTIAKRTATASPVTVSWWNLVLGYAKSGWAVAALLAVAWLLVSLPRPALPTLVSTSDHFSADPASASERQSGKRQPSQVSNEASRKSVASASPTSSATASNAIETQPLKDRVRVLSEQVAVLTHVLAQRTVLPPGASQLRVFRLVGTNLGPDTLDALVSEAPRLRAESAPTDLSFTLTLAAARQIAASTSPKDSATATDSPSDPSATSPVDSGSASTSQSLTASVDTSASDQGSTSGLTTEVASLQPATDPGAGADALTVGDGSNSTAVVNRGSQPVTNVEPDLAATTDSAIQVVDLSGDLTSSSGGNLSFGNLVASDTTSTSTSKSAGSAWESAAFGTYELETGIGSIAFRNTLDASNSEVLQLWVTDSHSGAVQSVGFVHSTNAVVVMRFRTDPAFFVNPNFLVTLEPEGGSATPTGPVVAQPPPSFSPIQPAP